MHRRMFVAAALVAAALASFVASTAFAQAYPEKPVTMIVPWPAGGSTDIAMRTIAEAAAKHLGQPIVIDNKPGASGTLGPAVMAATAKPDGYTIAQMPITVMRLPLMQKTTWDALKDFTYIVHLTGYTFGITTKADGQFKSWADVVAFAKANPGKVTYATPGAGTSLHIGMEQIAAQAGIQLTHVPFKGGAETNAAVLGGHTTLQAELDRLEAAGRRRPAAPAGDLDGRAQQELARRADAQGAGLSLRVQFALRRRRAQGHGSGGGAEAARCLQEGDRGQGGDRDDGQVRHGAALSRHRRTTASSSREIIDSEKAALEKIGAGQEESSKLSRRGCRERQRDPQL